MKPRAVKKCLVRQPAGLGDILYCKKLLKPFIDKGYEVIWPVNPFYFNDVNNYIEHSGILFFDETGSFPLKEHFTTLESSDCGTFTMLDLDDGDIYIPFQYADREMRGEACMKAKSRIVGVSEGYGDWSEDIVLQRDHEKEQTLYYDVLNLTDDDNYTLVHNTFGCPAPPWESYLKPFSIPQDEESPVVQVQIYSGFSLFDWCKVIENASRIYSVDTSLVFLVDLLDVKATDLQLYSRHTPANYLHVDDLFKSKWKYNY